MAGRPSKIHKEILISIFEKNEKEVIDNGSVRVPSHQIWMKICADNSKALKSTNPKAVYMNCLRWWKENNKKKSKESEASAAEDFSTETTINSSSQSSSKADDIKFTINLSKENWDIIEPVPTNYKRKLDKSKKSSTRKYLVLPPGTLTNVLVDNIAKHPKDIKCSFTFKRGKVYANGKEYIKIFARVTLTFMVKLNKSRQQNAIP